MNGKSMVRTFCANVSACKGVSSRLTQLLRHSLQDASKLMSGHRGSKVVEEASSACCMAK